MGISGKTTFKPWFLDSGASNHMTSSSQTLASFFPYCGQSKVHIADGKCLPIMGTGDIQSKTLNISGVFLVPQLSTNLTFSWTAC